VDDYAKEAKKYMRLQFLQDIGRALLRTKDRVMLVIVFSLALVLIFLDVRRGLTASQGRGIVDTLEDEADRHADD